MPPSRCASRGSGSWATPPPGIWPRDASRAFPSPSCSPSWTRRGVSSTAGCPPAASGMGSCRGRRARGAPSGDAHAGPSASPRFAASPFAWWSIRVSWAPRCLERSAWLSWAASWRGWPSRRWPGWCSCDHCARRTNRAEGSSPAWPMTWARPSLRSGVSRRRDSRPGRAARRNGGAGPSCIGRRSACSAWSRTCWQSRGSRRVASAWCAVPWTCARSWWRRPSVPSWPKARARPSRSPRSPPWPSPTATGSTRCWGTWWTTRTGTGEGAT